jgi:hypothetical protein
MTNENSAMTPFILRFAQRLPEVAVQALRYDSSRDVSQVLVDDRWVDAPDARGGHMSDTRITRVLAETQDDA